MNAESTVRFRRFLWQCLCGWIALAPLASVATERSWLDAVGTPWADPLRTRPPQLDAGPLLPGDIAAPGCADAAQDFTRLLGLQDVVDIALCLHPQLRAATAHIEKGAAQVGEARAAYLPSLQLGHSQTDEGTYTPNAPEALRHRGRQRASDFAVLSWRLLDFGTRDAQRRSASAALQSALASRDAVVQQTLARVIAAYFDAQIAAAALRDRQQHQELARQTWQTSRQRQALGAASRSDTLQAQISLSKAELDSRRAGRGAHRTLAALARAMGVPDSAVPLQGLRLRADLPDATTAQGTDLSGLLAEAARQHPALQAARAQLEQAQQQLQATRAEGFPTLDLSYGLYRNGLPNQGLFPEPSEQTVGTLTLRFPLFEGFSRTYKVRGAEAQLALKEVEVLELENRVLGEVREAHADAEVAVENLRLSRQLLDTAVEVLQLVQKQYDLGVIDILAVLAVQRSLSEAQQERIRALSDWHSARLRLLAQVGALGRALTQTALVPPES